jgi:hypothetical protein
LSEVRMIGSGSPPGRIGSGVGRDVSRSATLACMSA